MSDIKNKTIVFIVAVIIIGPLAYAAIIGPLYAENNRLRSRIADLEWEKTPPTLDPRVGVLASDISVPYGASFNIHFKNHTLSFRETRIGIELTGPLYYLRGSIMVSPDTPVYIGASPP